MADDKRGAERLKRAVYERELLKLQAKLVTMQEWVRTEGARVLVLFEGRDAAGKGSAIKRVTEYVNPRVARIVALPEGQRPYRVHIDPANDGSAEVSKVADRIRREFLTRIDLADLLTAAK